MLLDFLSGMLLDVESAKTLVENLGHILHVKPFTFDNNVNVLSSSTGRFASKVKKVLEIKSSYFHK